MRGDRFASDNQGDRFRNRKESDDQRPQRHAVIKIVEAEGGADIAADRAIADHGDGDAQPAGEQSLDESAGADHGDRHHADHCQQKEFRRAENQDELACEGKQRQKYQRTEHAAYEVASIAGADGDAGQSFLRHRIAIEHRRLRGSAAGDAEQDRRHRLHQIGGRFVENRDADHDPWIEMAGESEQDDENRHTPSGLQPGDDGNGQHN